MDRQLVPRERVGAWLRAAAASGDAFEDVVVRESAYTPARLRQVLENHFFCPSADLSGGEPPPEVLGLLPRELALHHEAVPVGTDGDRLVVAIADPTDERVLDTLARTAGCPVLPRVALRSDIARALEAWYPEPASGSAPAGSRRRRRPVAGSAAAAPRIDLDGIGAVAAVERILQVAVERDATDVHLHPAADRLVVRLRIDGILQTVAEVPPEKQAAVIARVKVASDLDIAEHRVPQDGRRTIELNGSSVDLRVSTLPSQFGENVVIRLLRKDTSLLELDRLHMPPAIREPYEDVLTSPQGFYLVTGPTGSGKTTTLYATLNALRTEEINVTTLEDPIEYTLPGITQVQIHEAAGLTFAGGLRSILRQDPDVVLVGEIRDLETVEIACRAALTGHKVLSTLHTNDAVQAITRLLDMGLAPHLLTATLRGVLAQRLVRTVCPDCRETYRPDATELAVLGYPKDPVLTRGTGCDRCGGTGYRGRVALFEYFRVEEDLHRLILDRASPFAIRHAAQRGGMIAMADFAKKAVLDGTTTASEAQRVVFHSEGGEQLCSGCGRVVSAEFAVCPFCQHNLKERCAGCGAAVESDWEACPSCGRELEREWQKIFCRNCLAPVDASWTSCRYCGEAIR